MSIECNWGRRFSQPFVLLGLAAAIVQAAVTRIFERGRMHPLLGLLLGFFPGFMWTCFIVAFVLAVKKRDELQRRIVLEAAAIAFLLTVALALVFEGLASTGVYHASVTAVVGPAIWGWLAVFVFLNWRYR